MCRFAVSRRTARGPARPNPPVRSLNRVSMAHRCEGEATPRGGLRRDDWPWRRRRRTPGRPAAGCVAFFSYRASGARYEAGDPRFDANVHRRHVIVSGFLADPLGRPIEMRITHDRTPSSPVLPVASPRFSVYVPRARVSEKLGRSRAGDLTPADPTFRAGDLTPAGPAPAPESRAADAPPADVSPRRRRAAAGRRRPRRSPTEPLRAGLPCRCRPTPRASRGRLGGGRSPPVRPWSPCTGASRCGCRRPGRSRPGSS